jgi:predicted chitinase
MAIEVNSRKSVTVPLNHTSDKDDFVEVTEWINGEGFDICINQTGLFGQISMSHEVIEAVVLATKLLDRSDMGKIDIKERL